MISLTSKVIQIPTSEKSQGYFRHRLRESLFVTLQTSTLRAHAEYAPLAGIHSCDIKSAAMMLTKLSKRDLEMLLALDPTLDWADRARFFAAFSYPVSWVLSCLFYNINMPPKSAHKLKLSGLILENLHEIKNYSHVKLKTNNINLVNNISNLDVKIRLDANRKLNFTHVNNLIKQINIKNLQYFEEPLNNINNLARVYDTHGIDLALDESFNELSSWYDLEQTKARYLIFKPSRFSSVYAVLSRAREALSHNFIPILSTCFESPWSAALYALMASELPILDQAHGIWVDDFFDLSAKPRFLINEALVDLSEAWNFLYFY